MWHLFIQEQLITGIHSNSTSTLEMSITAKGASVAWHTCSGVVSISGPDVMEPPELVILWYEERGSTFQRKLLTKLLRDYPIRYF
jgi:hypothetical protein